MQEAIELLTAHPEAKIIAGGSDVLIKIREGRMAGCELVSIYGIDELRGISMDEDGTIRIRPIHHADPVFRLLLHLESGKMQ